MSFAGKVWRLLVGIKDALSLVFLLLFFILLFEVLSSRPSRGAVRQGALLIDLDGDVVEESSRIDPLAVLLSGALPTKQYQARDLVRALDAAATDSRIKAVALDLTEFTGGGQVHMEAIGAALDRVRAAKKPVLTFALAYGDDAMMLAAHASEVWVDPLGGVIVMGPGGQNLYYRRLIDKLGVNAHVYRVGTYKSAVEPYMLSGMSPAARANAEAFYGALWEDWQANVKRARPKADIDLVTKRTIAWLDANKGDTAKAALAAGLADKIGDRVAFGERVAEIAGDDNWSDEPGAFAHTDLKPWLAATTPGTPGKAIGVITIAGDISDGDEGPGEAGGERIAKLLDDALGDDLAALVVRVDSPGGTVTGAEAIRRAIMRQKAKGIPVAVSMGNLAASGGYWVSTPGDRIFAEPGTITGSIGIFGVVPSFEKSLAKLGVDADGVRTTPLSGQLDVLGGFTPEVEAVLQKTVEHGYDQFTSLVATSRGKTPAQIDAIGQGQVWDGGTAHQIGLVDQFGGLDEALAWAAAKAGLKHGQWHAKFLGSKPDRYSSLIEQLVLGDADDSGEARAHDMVAFIALRERDAAGKLTTDLDRLLGVSGAQAYCLECPSPSHPPGKRTDSGVLAMFEKLLGN
jgi:protease-4